MTGPLYISLNPPFSSSFAGQLNMCVLDQNASPPIPPSPQTGMYLVFSHCTEMREGRGFPGGFGFALHCSFIFCRERTCLPILIFFQNICITVEPYIYSRTFALCVQFVCGSVYSPDLKESGTQMCVFLCC